MAVPSVTGSIVDPRKIAASSCEFRSRLSNEEVDHWWDYSDHTMLARAVEDAAQLYQKVGRSFFERFTSPDNEVIKITPESSINPGYAASLGTSEARLYRALAHMRLAADRTDEAVQFAKMALADGNPSWRAYSELQNLIRRLQD